MKSTNGRHSVNIWKDQNISLTNTTCCVTWVILIPLSLPVSLSSIGIISSRKVDIKKWNRSQNFEKTSRLEQTIASWDSYKSDDPNDADVQKAMYDYLAGEYARVYEVLLATENIEAANKVSRKLLSLNKDGATYHALIKAAKAAGKNAMAGVLLNEAHAELSPDEYTIAVEGKPKKGSCTGSS